MLTKKYLNTLPFWGLLLICFFPLSALPQARTSWEDGRWVRLSILVLVRNGNRQTFLHGARVSIYPLSSENRQYFDFPKNAITGSAGVAFMGALPPSVMVGNYRIVVSHPNCGTIERSFSLAQSSRPQTISMAFYGACGY